MLSRSCKQDAEDVYTQPEDAPETTVVCKRELAVNTLLVVSNGARDIHHG